jgi:hypothetical protein
MIIFIFIFVFIIIIALIVVVIGYGKGNSGYGKGNKKFTFQYKHKKQPPPPQVPSVQVPSVQVPSVVTYEQENQYPPKVPLVQPQPPSLPPPPKVPSEKVPLAQPLQPPSPPPPPPKVPLEKVPTEKVLLEKVPLLESNQKTESNIHNCEDNYIWNKYLKRCMTTECPMETYLNCSNKGWTLSYNIIPPNPNDEYVPTNVYTANMGGLSPSLVEKICEQLNIPVPEEGEVCWSECQHKYVKLECPKMTMEECTAITPGYGWNDSPQATLLPLNPSLFTRGETCGQISTFTPEYQLETLFPADTGINPNRNVVLPGEICWSAACGKCVKPYVKPLTREQGLIKHNFNPACFPNNQTCQRDVKRVFTWLIPNYNPSSTSVVTMDEYGKTCEELSTFTEWGKYNLNPLVLPGEVCYNPCTGGCIAPIDW